MCSCGEKIPEWYLRQKEQKDYEAMMKRSIHDHSGECSAEEYLSQVHGSFACCQCWDGEDQEIDSGFCRCGGCGVC